MKVCKCALDEYLTLNPSWVCPGCLSKWSMRLCADTVRKTCEGWVTVPCNLYRCKFKIRLHVRDRKLVGADWEGRS